MSKNQKVGGTPIGNLLYTTESEDSAEKTKAELQVPDPAPEKAYGVLGGNPPQTENAKHEPSNP